MGRRLKRYVERAGLPGHVTPHTLRRSAAVHYLIGGAPITFVQNLLGHESLATTGVYTQLVDQMAKEIALNTKTAIDEMEPAEEGELLREARDVYELEFEGWDDSVQALEWFGANQESIGVRLAEVGRRGRGAQRLRSGQAREQRGRATG